MNTTDRTRRLDLDWIRIAAFALLIAYHVGMYYVSWGWHIKSPFASETLEPLMLALNPWRLSLLFLVSGCASAFMLRDTPRSALGRIARQRSRFLLVPLVFGMLIVVPPQSYYEVMDKLGFGGGYLAFWQRYLAADHSFCPDGRCLILPTWNHLWFVVYLWAYTMLLLAVRAFAPAGLAAAVRRPLAGWGLLAWPWLWLAFARVVLFPRFGMTHALVDDLYNHAQYLPVFAIGYLIARDDAAWDWLVSRRRTLLAVALASYSVFLTYALGFGADNLPPDALRAAVRVDYALLQWSAILAALAWARHLLAARRDTKARAYLTDAVFCYYIVHQTAIVVAAHAMRPLGLHPGTEGPLLILVTAATCAVSYEIARRIPFLRPLFGIRAGRISLPAAGISRRPAGVSS
jgi:surface polysaccharide O-acyltransferase-like enzyme